MIRAWACYARADLDADASLMVPAHPQPTPVTTMAEVIGQLRGRTISPWRPIAAAFVVAWPLGAFVLWRLVETPAVVSVLTMLVPTALSVAAAVRHQARLDARTVEHWRQALAPHQPAWAATLHGLPTDEHFSAGLQLGRLLNALPLANTDLRASFQDAPALVQRGIDHAIARHNAALQRTDG